MDLTPDKQTILDDVTVGKNVLVAGKAGTGKSVLARAILDRFPNTVAAAPTGIAALNVGGVTLHKLVGLKPGVTLRQIQSGRYRPPTYVRDVLAAIRVLVVDEISMVRADLLDQVWAMLQKYGAPGLQIVMVGDLAQLPPVVLPAEHEWVMETYGSPYFFASQAYENIAPVAHVLKVARRQNDHDFVSALDNVRYGMVDENILALLNTRVGVDVPGPVLAATNREVDAINSAHMGGLPGRAIRSVAKISGRFPSNSFPAPETLEYKTGARVVTLVNAPDGEYVNGSLGTISQTGKNMVEIVFDDGTVSVVEKHEWVVSRPIVVDGELVQVPVGVFRQFPFRLAWALTIHKSQGMTLDSARVCPERIFAPGQLYVALSRLRSLSGLSLGGPVSVGMVRPPVEALGFLASIGDRVGAQ